MDRFILTLLFPCTQADPGDLVSVPALHDAMGISIETVPPEEDKMDDQQQSEQVTTMPPMTTASTISTLNDKNELEEQTSDQQ